jgi:two-component system response regulator HydG
MTKSRVLVIEDDPDGRRSVTEALQDGGLAVESATKGGDGVRMFREGAFNAVLSDLVLPDIDGLEVFKRIRQADALVPVLIMTAYGTVSSAVQALKDGVYDYITKPLDLDELQAKVLRAVETHRLRTEVAQLAKTIHDRHSAANMVAGDPSIRRLIDQIRTVAPTNATVLILGESGTGKELVARALHVDGLRGLGPFVAVNCGAFAESVLESELFGHEKGSFTGASALHRGAFERAHGGTLFLDEIGNAPPSVQVKLLRVLEEREVMRVGGQTPIPVDVRIVSASNRILDDLVEDGAFRADLLYRLKVVTLDLPPLRARRGDIRPLADRFIAAACEEHGRTVASVEPGFYEALAAFDWPGNVRQLRNALQSAVVMATSPTLRVADLRLTPAGRSPADKGVGEWLAPENLSLAEIEKAVLVQMLRRHDGNRTLVADQLGISRRTIQRKIKDHQLPF